jgi:hypothetical protein
LTGRSFASLTTNYLKAILDKNVCIESTYEWVIKVGNDKAMEDASKALEERMGAISKMFPVSAKVVISSIL